MACVVGGVDCAGVGAFAAISMSCPGCARPAYPVLPAFPEPAMVKQMVVGGGEGGGTVGLLKRERNGGGRRGLEGRAHVINGW